MIYPLIKQDPAWKAVKPCLAFLIGFYFVRMYWRTLFPWSPPPLSPGSPDVWDILHAHFAELAAKGGATLYEPQLRVIFYAFYTPASWLLMYILLWSSLMAAGDGARGATPFLMSLPVSRRQILVARVASLTVLVWSSFYATHFVFDVMGAQPSTPVWKLLGFPAAGTLAMVMLQSTRPRKYGYAVWCGLFCCFATAVSAAPLVAPVPPFMVVTFAVALLVLALLIFLFAWRVALPSFELMLPGALSNFERNNTLEQRSVLESFGPLTGQDLPGWWRVAVTGRLRDVRRWHLLWALLEVGFLLISVGFLKWWWMPLSMMSTFEQAWGLGGAFSGRTAVRFQPARWLSTLPMHPRRPLLMATAYLLIATLAGYLLGIHLLEFNDRLRVVAGQHWNELKEGASVDSECQTLNVAPPLEFWQPVEGQSPTIRSPWGEEFRPPLSSVLGLSLYNPYAVGCRSSKQFFSWQYERAVLALYGERLRFDPNGDYPEVVPQPRRQVVTAAFLTTAFLLVAIFIAMGNGWRVGRFPWLRRLFGILQITVYAVIAAGGPLLVVLSGGSTRSLLLVDPLLRLVWALPDSFPVVIAITVIPVIVLCWILNRVSREMEFLGGASSVG